MISTIVAAVSLVTIVLTTSVIIAKGTDLKKQYDDKLRVMTDQINNAQHYNTEIDKKNIQDLKDVRATYTTKDEVSRSVDTRELMAKKATATDLSANSVTGNVLKVQKSTADSLRADKLISPGGIVGNLDAANVNTSQINLTGHKENKGMLNFDSSGNFFMQEKGDSLVANMPDNSYFKVAGKNTVSIQPTKGEISFGNKWSVGKIMNEDADKAGIKYDALGMSFDNKEIVGLYSLEDGRKFGRFDGNFDVTGKDDSWMSVTSDQGDPVFMGTNSTGKGIATMGDKPFDIYASKVRMGKSEVGGVDFGNSYDDSTGNPALVHDKGGFTIYGKDKMTHFDENINVLGTAKGKVIHGYDKVTVGDESAYLKDGGLVFGKDVVGNTVRGNDRVVAGEMAATMSKDGTIFGSRVNTTDVNATNLNASEFVRAKNVQVGNAVSINNGQVYADRNGNVFPGSVWARDWMYGKNVFGVDNVFAGPIGTGASMSRTGAVIGKTGVFSEGVNVGNVNLNKSGAIVGKTLAVNSINPQAGLTVEKGPMKLSNGVTFGMDGNTANSRLFVASDGRVGVGTPNPRTNVDIVGNMYVNGISRPAGDNTNLRINYENIGRPTAAKIELHNGAYVAGNGLYVGGTGVAMPANGVVQASANVVTPRISAPTSTDWFRINQMNENNGTNQGTAVYNGMAVHGGRGLYVGAWKTSPSGIIEASSKVVAPVIEAKTTLTAPSFSTPNLTATTALTTPTVNASTSVNAPLFTATTNVKSPKFEATTETISPVFKTGTTTSAAVFNATSITIPNVDASTKINAPSIGAKSTQTGWFMMNPDNSTAGVRVNGPFATSGGIYSGASTTNKEAAGVIRAANQMCINTTCLTETELKTLKSRLAIS